MKSSEQPQPCTSSSRGSLRPSSPDTISGPQRAAPPGEERVALDYTVSVSPRGPREVSLLPLPGLQGAAASGEHISRVSPPTDVAELGCLPPLRGSLEQLVWQSPACLPLQVSKLAVQSTPEASPEQVFSTLVGPEQALVMEQEVETLLRKEAIEVVPSHDRETRFYSRYFIVPKKDGGLRPILDLRRLNRSVMRLRFKMLNVKQIVSQIRSKDWSVTIYLKNAYFHVSILPQHRKFLRFAFRGEAYQYQVLPFGLALLPHTFIKCVDAALVSLHLQGIRMLNYIDYWLILAQSEKNHLPRRAVGFDHEAGTLVPCSDRVNPRESKKAVVAQNQGVLLFANPLRMIKATWRKPWFLSQGPVLGVPCRGVTLATDTSLSGWGGGHERSYHPRSVEWSPSQLAVKPLEVFDPPSYYSLPAERTIDSQPNH
ncbi:Transposon Ty3-G Gag-Pol polyprotein [Labeo rohita]|uniref:ribonuclease H n=1 Tax=Labeo rohita TaxID=84645 RepID=A0ABQ8L2V6_LABRO|nr:Transposon Ty3-G Gag-Pol polyprotein [Labeo rohita]